jgi:hypothetical protein
MRRLGLVPRTSPNAVLAVARIGSREYAASTGGRREAECSSRRAPTSHLGKPRRTSTRGVGIPRGAGMTGGGMAHMKHHDDLSPREVAI